MKIIDIHTHGISGYDTRTTLGEHILEISRIHGALGVDEIIPTLYASPVPVMRQQMAVIREAMDQQEQVQRDSAPASGAHGPARIIGVHLEGPFLNPARCGSLNAATFLEPSEYNLNALLDGFEDIVRIVTLAPELDGAPRLITRLADGGIRVSMGHSDATYAEAEAGFMAGARCVTHLFNAMRRFHHREPGLAGFGLMNREVYVEIIADPFHLHPGTVDLIFGTKDLRRVIIVSDSVAGTRKDGGIHPQALADRHGMLIGGAFSVVAAARNLIDRGFPEDDIMKTITENPGRYLAS